MANIPLVWSVALVAAALVPPGRGTPRDDPRTAFEEAAVGLRGLDLGAVLYDRLDSRSGALLDLQGRHDDVDQLLPLLEHADSRVRSLAAIVLFDREDPGTLTAIHRLVRDEAPAIPRLQPVHLAFGEPPAERPLEETSVGTWARSLVEFYMERAGYYGGVEGRNGRPGFEEYWREREGRSTCASWFYVQLQRAHGGGVPVTPQDQPAIDAVRAAVDELPPGERELTLLWLGCVDDSPWSPAWEGIIADESECLHAARELGREQLFAILSGRVDSADPDLCSGRTPVPGALPESIVVFLLRHAVELFESEDAPALLALGEDPSAVETARWDIAQAGLRPGDAAEILSSAWARFREPHHEWQRGELLVAWWRRVRGTRAGDLGRLFYDESTESSHTPSARVLLIRALATDGGVHGRVGAAELVRHADFAHIDGESLVALGQLVNDWVEPGVIDAAELRELRHPLGTSRLRTRDQRRRAQESHPEATELYLRLLADWRGRLIASLPRWE